MQIFYNDSAATNKQTRGGRGRTALQHTPLLQKTGTAKAGGRHRKIRTEAAAPETGGVADRAEGRGI